MLGVNHSDLEGVKDAILPWLRAKLPRVEDIQLPPLTAPAGGGSSQTLFLDPLIVESGAQRRARWVLRIQATGHQIYQDPAVEKQFLVMEKLAALGDVPVPAVLWYEADPAILGAPFFVMERVEGQVPEAFYHNQGLFTQVDEVARRQLWTSAVDALARIHRADPAAFAFLDRPPSAGTGLDREIARWDAYSDWCDVPLKPAQEKARLWLEDHLPGERPTGLAWGDARLPNMVFRGERCVAVIDWETASLGGAETDLGWWLFFDWYISDGMGRPRLPGLPDGEDFLATWEGFAGRQARDMHWHQVFATWRFSMISGRARLLAGYPQEPEAACPIARRLGWLMAF